MASFRKLQEQIQRRLQEFETAGQKFFKPKEGENRFNILPARKKGKLFYKEVDMHYGFGPDKNRAFVCIGPKCPGCKRVQKLANSASPKKQKRAERMAATRQVVFQIKPDKARKVLMWTTNTTRLNEILAWWNSGDYGSDFTHPKRNHQIILRRRGTTMRNTRYKMDIAPKPMKIKGWKKLKKQLFDLDKEYAPKTVEQVKAIMAGTDRKDSEEE